MNEMNIERVNTFFDLPREVPATGRGQIGRFSWRVAACNRRFAGRGRLYGATLAVLEAIALLAGPLDVQARVKKLTLTITRVRQIDNLDSSRPGELYAKVQIGNRAFPKTGHREDDGDVSPNWTFVSAADENSPVRITIGIFDHDDPDADDHCDVSPVDGKKTLEIFYHLRTDQVAGDVVGHGGELIHVRGRGDGDRVEMWFRVSQTDPPAPPARGIHPGDLPSQVSCGSCTVSRAIGAYERSTSVDLPCPRISSVQPSQTFAGQWISVAGSGFGQSADRIGPCYRGPKKVMITRLIEGGAGVPAPIQMRMSGWSNDRINVLIPANLNPGRYRVGIFYPLIPGSRLSSGLVSNMVTVEISR